MRLGGTLAGDSHADAWLGLSPATHVVVTAGAEKLLDFTFGRAGSRGAAVRLGGAPQVKIAEGLAPWRFHREPRFWRNRLIWQLEAEDVQRIELTKGHAWVFTRHGSQWQATLDGRPSTVKQDRVLDLLRAFRHLLAEDVAAAAADTGLGKDAAVARFVTKDGRARVLRIGKQRADKTYYASAEGDPTVYTIGEYPAVFATRTDAARWR